MSLDLETIRRLIDRCDPQRPLAEDSPLYIPLDRDPPVRGEWACIEVMRRTILHAAGPTCQLFTGFPGTGKTTELRRLTASFQESPPPTSAHVLTVDFEQWIHRYRPVQLSDVLRTLTFCLAAEADRVEATLSPELHGERYMRQFFTSVQKALPSSAEFKSVKFELFGTALMLELRNNPTIHQQVEQGVRARFQHFARECATVMKESLARIRQVVGGKADRFIVIADGLEKLDGLDQGDRDAVENAAESLFIGHSEFLRLPCHVIYTFPVWLRFRTAQLGSSYSCEPQTLPMVKIRDQDGAPFVAGLDKLYDLIRVRLEDPARVFGPDPKATLRPLLEASGGYPRDALRMVRSVLQREETFPVSPGVVEREIRSLQQTYHAMVLGTHAQLLDQIARTHQIPNDTPEQLRLFGELFARFLVLAYRNGQEWFDIHPLVRKAPALVRHFGAQAAP